MKFYVTKKQVFINITKLIVNSLIFFGSSIVLSFLYPIAIKYVFRFLIYINELVDLSFPLPGDVENGWLHFLTIPIYLIFLFIIARPIKFYLVFKRLLNNKYIFFIFAFVIGAFATHYIQDGSLELLKDALKGNVDSAYGIEPNYTSNYFSVVEQVQRFIGGVVGYFISFVLRNIIVIGIFSGSIYAINKAIYKLKDQDFLEWNKS